MAHDHFHDGSEIVSTFLLCTCLPQQLTYESMRALDLCANIAAQHPRDFDDEVAIIPLITGSVAEFYIHPMSPCVGDIDIMYFDSDQLAIPEGTAPPTQLPAEFHSCVQVYDIIDSEFPGYVYLVSSYMLAERPIDGCYNAVQCPREYEAGIPDTSDTNGPAEVTKWLLGGLSSFLRVSRAPDRGDLVFSKRCLSWPSQAADWPTRQRNYGWPDSATIGRVVSNGYDVVHVSHRQCRQDEWKSRHQWRLSFSRAEIVLLSSWMPVQQIIYHMLRYLLKARGLTEKTDNTGTKILNNYTLKTLMLWACELKPISWWTEDLNVVRTCVELLNTLAVWLTDARCKHYFINNCNLLDRSNSTWIQSVATSIAPITETWLAEWFIRNYVQKCAHLLPRSGSWLSDNVRTRKYLDLAVFQIVQERTSALLLLSSACFELDQYTVIIRVSIHSLTETTCSYWITQLGTLYPDLSHYFTAVTFLHVARRITRNSLEDELLDILAITCLQSNDVRGYRNARHSSLLSLAEATNLMKVVANNSRSTVQLIVIELSKAYLNRVLRCKDSVSDSLYCLANVYLAVLYYATGQYQTAIDHCTLVTRSQDHSQCSLYIVGLQGEFLPKIDDETDNVLGLVVFYHYVRAATGILSQQRTQHVSVFTAELFAHYMCNKCLSITRCSQLLTDEIQRYQQCFYESNKMFITDVLAFKSVSDRKYQRRFRKLMFDKDQTKPVTSVQLDTSELVELLQQSAVEHLTMTRQLEAQKFGSELTTVTSDYEALYAYKCGEYQRCLQLSRCNVRKLCLDVQGCKRQPHFLYPEFIQLMDDDIASLTGLMLLVNPSCREGTTLINTYVVTQLSLSLYLMTQCQIKLHRSVTSPAQSLLDIYIARRRSGLQRVLLDQFLLKLTEQKILRFISV